MGAPERVIRPYATTSEDLKMKRMLILIAPMALLTGCAVTPAQIAGTSSYHLCELNQRLTWQAHSGVYPKYVERRANIRSELKGRGLGPSDEDVAISCMKLMHGE